MSQKSSGEQQLNAELARMEQAVGWEWSELLGWLGQLQTALDSAETLTPRQLRLLAKRLHQCLQPMLPELVHLETLKVYSAAISKVPQGPCQSLYISALYSFFTYAKEDSQESMLCLFSEFLLPSPVLTSASLDAFLTAMLMGLDESQFAQQITAVLADLRKAEQLGFEQSLWRVVLKVPSIRRPALELYLKICENGVSEADQIAVSALVTTLWSSGDCDTLVAAILVVSRLFPVHTERISVLQQRKLVAGMVNQLSNNREAVTKPIVKWLGAGLHDKDAMQNLVVPVLMDLFTWLNTDEKTSTDCLNRLECLLETRGLEDLRVCVMQGFSFHLLSYIHNLFEFTCFGERIQMKAGLLLNSLEDVAETVWASLVGQFLEGFGVGSVQGIPVFLFALESYQVPKASGLRLVSAATEIVYRISSLSDEDYRLCLKILREISMVTSGISLPLPVLQHCDSVISNTLIHSVVNAAVAMDWLCHLHVSSPEAPFDESIAVLVSFVSSGDIAHQQLLLRLFAPASAGLEEVISKRLGISLSFAVFRQLWELSSDSAGQLLLNMACERPKRFAAFLGEQLAKSDSCLQVRRFSRFWYLSVRYRELELESLFQSRPGLIKVLALLRSEDYSTRQEAAYWLSASLSQADILINTLIDQLKTAETEGLQLLTSVLRTAGEALVETLTRQTDFPLAKSLLTALLDLIENGNTESAVSASESLALLLSHRNSSLAMFCFSRVLCLLNICHSQYRLLVLMKLIEVLRIITLRNGLEERPADLRSKIGSQDFETAYLLPIGREDELLWDTWVRFQVDTMPLVFALIRPIPLIEIIKGLLQYYLPTMPSSAAAIEAVIYCSLDLLDIDTFTKKNGELIKDSYTDLQSQQVKPELFNKNAVKSIAQGRVVGKSGYLFCDLAISVFLETKAIIKSIAGSLPVKDNPLKISAKGCDPFKVAIPRSDSLKETVDILRPLASAYPEVLFSQCVTLWHENYSNESTDCDLLFPQILELLHLLDFQPGVALHCAYYYLDMGLEIKKSKRIEDAKKQKSHEGALCHFLYTFLCGVAEATLETKATQKHCLTTLVAFLSLLAQTSNVESSLWQLHFLHLFCMRLTLDKVSQAKVEVLQKHYLRLFEELMLLVCSSDPTELSYPHSPSAYVKSMEQVSVRLAAFFSLTFTLKKCAELFTGNRLALCSAYEKEAKELLHTFLPLHNMTSDLVARLCWKLVREAGHDLGLTPLLMDFLKGELLWQQLQQEDAREIVGKWKYFVRIITNFAYADSKVSLVEDVLSVPLSYLTSKVNEIRMRANSIKLLAFMIYCEKKMRFEKALGVIVEHLIEYLRLHDGAYTPHSFLLLRAIMLKVDECTINEYWTRLWPHILTKLMQIFTNAEIAILHKWEALKLLDFLYVIKNEDFHRHLWIFTYNGADLENAGRYQHVPVVPREFKLVEDASHTRTWFPSEVLKASMRVEMERPVQAPETETELIAGAKDFFFQVLRGLSQSGEIDFHALRHAVEQDLRLL